MHGLKIASMFVVPLVLTLAGPLAAQEIPSGEDVTVLGFGGSSGGPSAGYELSAERPGDIGALDLKEEMSRKIWAVYLAGCGERAATDVFGPPGDPRGQVLFEVFDHWENGRAKRAVLSDEQVKLHKARLIDVVARAQKEDPRTSECLSQFVGERLEELESVVLEHDEQAELLAGLARMLEATREAARQAGEAAQAQPSDSTCPGQSAGQTPGQTPAPECGAPID